MGFLDSLGWIAAGAGDTLASSAQTGFNMRRQKRLDEIAEERERRRREQEDQERQLYDAEHGIVRGVQEADPLVQPIQEQAPLFEDTPLRTATTQRTLGMARGTDAPEPSVSTQAQRAYLEGLTSDYEPIIAGGTPYAYVDPERARLAEMQTPSRINLENKKEELRAQYPQFGQLIELAGSEDELSQILETRVPELFSAQTETAVAREKRLGEQTTTTPSQGRWTPNQAFQIISREFAEYNEDGYIIGYRIPVTQIMEMANQIATGMDPSAVLEGRGAQGEPPPQTPGPWAGGYVMPGGSAQPRPSSRPSSPRRLPTPETPSMLTPGPWAEGYVGADTTTSPFAAPPSSVPRTVPNDRSQAAPQSAAVIDRIEGEMAVVEMPNGTFQNIPRSELPANAKEGSVITQTGGGWTVDVVATRDRLAQAAGALGNLRSRGRAPTTPQAAPDVQQKVSRLKSPGVWRRIPRGPRAVIERALEDPEISPNELNALLDEALATYGR